MKRLLAVILTMLLLLVADPVGGRLVPRYRSYTVVEITEKTFVLEDKAGQRVELDRVRLPGARIGEVIYYDKVHKLLWHGERAGR